MGKKKKEKKKRSINNQILQNSDIEKYFALENNGKQ